MLMRLCQGNSLFSSFPTWLSLLQIKHGLPGPRVITQQIVHRGILFEQKGRLGRSWEIPWEAGLKQRPRCAAESHLALRMSNEHL